MNSFTECLRVPLSLLKKEKLDNPKDWVSLWEKMSVVGPAVLLESAGTVHDASRWIVLAGNPQMEYFEKKGQAWWGKDLDLAPAQINIFCFLDEISFNGSKAKTGNQYSFDRKIYPLGHSPACFLPFPYGLSEAWFGIFSYEFGRDFNLKTPRPSYTNLNLVPDYYFFKPGSIMAFDRVSKELYYFGKDIQDVTKYVKPLQEPFGVDSLRARLSLENYKDMVERVKCYIEQGDIYQANIAQSFQAEWKGSSGSLYRQLKEINPGPFMGLFQGRGFTVVSSSPERLVSGQGDWLETRPIAGTRPRGQDEVRDLQQQWELKTNPKEQAEHLMLVDLARSDMGKIADFGTVEVKSFASVESYAKVQHLVSVIQARLATQNGFTEILKSLFPGGTITGCPKIRCMEIIEEIESGPRGFYTGSMGYVAPGPCFDFNILIRSLTLYPDGSLEFYAGAGIVADSNPEREYRETLFKVEALAQALGSSFITGE